jgi:hypothetical protein
MVDLSAWLAAVKRRPVMNGARFLRRSGMQAVAGALLSTLLAQSLHAAAPSLSAPSLGADQLLAEIRGDMAAERLAAAQEKADRLVRMYPAFRLGYLIRGDLLMMRTRPVAALGGGMVGVPDSALSELRHEAAARLSALEKRPAPGFYPRALLQLRADQKHALVMDASRSRLYVYEHRDGRLRLLADMYASQGKLGVGKLREGDLRTPLGLYNIVGHIPGSRLPDKYGKGALPLNYPNELDRLQGRAGSGIWIHGVPTEAFSRAPRSTDGCLVVNNDDLMLLTRTLEVGNTPVLIADTVDFVPGAMVAAERADAATRLEQWRRAFEAPDPAALRAYYSSSFHGAAGTGVAGWLVAQRRTPRAGQRHVVLRDPSFVRMGAPVAAIVTSFVQETSVGRHRESLLTTQYWVQENGAWKIRVESSVAVPSMM